jgi:hypothetical protein
MKFAKALLFTFCALFSACQSENAATAQRAFAKREDPRVFNKVMTNRHDPRVSSGVFARVPWADTYWPSALGGIAARWRFEEQRPVVSDLVAWKKVRESKLTSEQIEKLSPAEKFGLLKNE